MNHDGGEKKPPEEPDEAGGREPQRKQRAAHRRRLAPRLFLAYARTRAVEKFAVPDSASDSPPRATRTAVKEGFDLDEATKSVVEGSEIVRQTIAEMRKARDIGARALRARFRG